MDPSEIAEPLRLVDPEVFQRVRALIPSNSLGDDSILVEGTEGREDAAAYLMERCVESPVACALVDNKAAIQVLIRVLPIYLEHKDFRMTELILGSVGNLLYHEDLSAALSVFEGLRTAVIECIIESEDPPTLGESFRALETALRRPGKQEWLLALRSSPEFCPKVVWIMANAFNPSLLHRLLTAVNALLEEVTVGSEYEVVIEGLVKEGVVDALTKLVENYYWLWKSRLWSYTPGNDPDMPQERLYVEVDAADAALECLQCSNSRFQLYAVCLGHGDEKVCVRMSCKGLAFYTSAFRALLANQHFQSICGRFIRGRDADRIVGGAAVLLYYLHNESQKTAFITICAQTIDIILECPDDPEITARAWDSLALLGKSGAIDKEIAEVLLKKEGILMANWNGHTRDAALQALEYLSQGLQRWFSESSQWDDLQLKDEAEALQQKFDQVVADAQNVYDGNSLSQELEASAPLSLAGEQGRST